MNYEIDPTPNNTKSNFTVIGYWENWSPAIYPGGKNGTANMTDPRYYENDFKSMDHVIYSFLTLD